MARLSQQLRKPCQPLTPHTCQPCRAEVTRTGRGRGQHWARPALSETGAVLPEGERPPWAPPSHGAFRKEDGRPGAGCPPRALRTCPSTLRGPRSDEQSPAVTRDKPRFPGQRDGYRCSACPGGRGQLLLGLGQRCHRPVTPPVLWLRRWQTGPAAPELQEAASPRPAARDVREDAASARAGVWGRPPGVWGCPGPNSGTLGLKASVESDSLFL